MRALVTGGGGFLGGAIVRKLLARGVEVVSFARGDYPRLAALGVRVERGDLADADAVARAARGCDAVFHVAALPAMWGPRARFFATNVTGTRNVIAACRAHGIGRLVHTSTPSVIHAGGHVEGADNGAPYRDRFHAHYPHTKAIAEREVLAANGPDLATVALRPHLIWGPGDTQIIPRILDRARRGRLRLVDGGRHLVDTVYVDNAADAHLCALDRLRPGAACAGRPYFVTNEEPRPQAAIINAILAAAGLPPCEASVGPRAAVAVGAVLEVAWWLTRRRSEPPLTRFVARQLGTAHWYDTAATRADLGFTPAVSLDEGFARLRAALAAEAAAPRAR
jgi:nucleoside-diphosphate-sugar epimerase